MKLAGSRRWAGIAAISAVALTLAACGDDNGDDTNGDGEETVEEEDTDTDADADAESDTDDAADDAETDDEESDTDDAAAGGDGLEIDYSSLSGTLNGSGATAQEAGMDAWRDEFAALSDVTVNYTGTGSGTGREQFLGEQVSFAGTDSPLNEEEIGLAEERCDGSFLQLPNYISPIAIAFNLDGIDNVNLSPENIAAIFNGEITNWSDEAITADNEDIDLPDQDIIPVNRSDDSGTTDNFTSYLIENVGEEGWPHEASDTWPITGTQSGSGTQGVVTLVESTPGAITYADASQIGDLGTVAVGVGDEFIEYSAEAAAAVVDGSPMADTATDTSFEVDLVRDGSVEGAYPVVLISYHIACVNYDDPEENANVQGFLHYVVSEDGQAAAADNAGIAPISQEARERAHDALAQADF